MQVANKVVVVTGGANGIGRALCRRFVHEGAKSVIIADVDHGKARELASEIGAVAIQCDVGRESDVQSLVKSVVRDHGAIDLFSSNAGVGVSGSVDAPDEDWEVSWRVNVMAHVYPARAVLPSMLARNEGYLLQTVSAAGPQCLAVMPDACFT